MNPQFDRSQNPFSSSTMGVPTVAQAPVEARLNFIRKTYVLFMAGILMAIAAGALCLNSTALFNMVIGVYQMPILLIGILFGSVMLAQAVSRIEGINYVALFGFTALEGILLAPMLALYERTSPGIVGQAAFLTTVIFGALTAYVFVTRKDFSFMGGILFVGLIALIVGGLANVFFFKSAGAGYWMAWVTAFLFSGYVLFDTSRIIHRYDEKGYCSAALALFLDFLNLFLAILRILGGRR